MLRMQHNLGDVHIRLLIVMGISNLEFDSGSRRVGRCIGPGFRTHTRSHIYTHTHTHNESGTRIEPEAFDRDVLGDTKRRGHQIFWGLTFSPSYVTLH